MIRIDERSHAGMALCVMVLGLLSLMALAGCNKSEDNGAPSITPPTAPKTETGGTGGSSNPTTGAKTVAVISPAKTSQFHVFLVEGAADEAKKLGWNFIDKAPQKENDYTGQVAVTQDVIQAHPDAISVCGINPQALSTIIQKANAAKIPIFVHNQIAKSTGDVVAYIGYDERAGGRMCGEEAAKLLKQKNGDYKGVVAILEGEPGDHTTERMGGFMDALKAYPNIQVVAHQNGQWLRAPSAQTTKDWLQRFPNLDLVFGCSDQMAQGAAKAAADANHPLITIGIDGNPDSLQDIKDGKMTATLAVQPKMMGAKVIDTMQDYFGGKKPKEIVETEMVIVTKENVDKFLSK